MTTPFAFDVVGELTAAPERVHGYLEEYFRPHDDPDQGYTGRFFEKFIALSDPAKFMPVDVVAVSTLSVAIPPAAAWRILLDPDTTQAMNGLLAQIPPDAELATMAPTDIDDASPAGRLYRMLRGIPGLGPTKASKLLATKRPALVPIRDSVVAILLGADKKWWEPFRELARDPKLQSLLNQTPADTVPADVTLLRRLDVVLWRWGKDT